MRKPFYLLVVCMLVFHVFPFNNLNVKAATPDDGIDGYQELHDDWTVTGYEEYTDEIIALWGDLTVQDGGHLVLNKCTLMMMSPYLQPYEIIVEDGGIMEVYDSYITDPPDDDDTQFLSAYYYFVARKGSTLMIENSTVRQHGFIDMVNPEHLGLSISTNSGHIINSRINSTIVGLAFFGNNTGFYVENSNISQIGMTAIMIYNAEGVILNNISFSETGESNVVDAQSSGNFLIENFNLEGDQFLRAEYSYGFEIRNIMSVNPERVLEINDCDDFKVLGVDIVNAQGWNRRISVERSTNFTFDDINDNDDTNVMFFGECSFGLISNVTGSNITWMIDSKKSDNITVKDVDVGGNEYVIRFTDSKHITMDRINIAGGRFPIYLDTVNESSISNLKVSDFSDTAVTIRDYSYNISVMDAYIKTSSMEFTKGIIIDYGYDVYVGNLETHDLNISLSCSFGSLYADNIMIKGTMIQKYGLQISYAGPIFLSNISIENNVQFGIHLRSSDIGSIRVDNLYIKDTEIGVYTATSNITIDNIKIDNSIEDIQAHWGSFVTIMNSTVDLLNIWDSTIICINTTNTTAAIFAGTSQLIKKWWVDVYVEDKVGAVIGATVYILDGSFIEDARGYTGSDGFARNLAATEVIWTFGPTADYKNPHKTEASGPGFWIDNITFYQVDRNMWVNVTYNGDARPFEPTNIMVRSDEASDTIITWDPSISLDVIGYNIYIAKSIADLVNYISLGIPNATVAGTGYTHLGGSANWDRFYYAIISFDNENESANRPIVICGDWVVNSSSPQYVENIAIDLHGSLLVYGNLQIMNITLTMNSVSDGIYGIYINNSGTFTAESFTVKRKFTYPYFFEIQSDAEIYINNSVFIQPGVDEHKDDWTKIGIFSKTNNLTITNSQIDVKFGGLGIYNVLDFNGLIYNVSFTTLMASEQVDFMIRIIDSMNVAITNCSLDGYTLYGIYAEASSNLNITENRIETKSFNQGSAWGIYLLNCANSRIYDNPLLKGNSPIYILFSTDIVVENSNISGHSLYGIHVESSWYTTISECYFDSQDNPDIGIYMSWSRESTIRDMESVQVNYFLLMENESAATIENISITSGDIGIRLINSDNILMNNTYINFIQNGMEITGCREIIISNSEINLTLFGLQIKSPGPIYLINFTLANCISGDLIAEGFEAEAGNIIFENSTIMSIADFSFVLNNSGVVHLINTTLNESKIKIEDGASRVEVYHYLSVQVYDIDNNIPAWANITIMNAIGAVIYDETAISGYAEWILIHAKTIFKDNTYLDNPHNFFVYDGSHLGQLEVNINYSQHLDVFVSNQFPIITFIGIVGYFDNPFPIPDDYTIMPKTNYDIILTYTYEDPENDPENGTIIHWYVNGVYNSTFDDMTTITPQYTQKGQLWQAYVYPSDGYNGTYPFYAFESNIIPIINTPPSVSNVTVTPSDPDGGDDLYVEFDVYDMDDDGLDSSKTTSKWYWWDEINGWIYSSIDSFYLPSQYTSKGEIWKCRITPHDGDDAGAFVDSENVTIGNTPPMIQNARITTQGGSTIITGANNLKAQYIFLDADFDLENGTAYEWQYQRSGSPWTAVSVNSSILPNTYTQRGDLWRCRIIPKDGEDFGAEVLTDAVEVFNTPPQISNVTINPQYATSEDVLEVTYDFYDYDGDSDNGTSFRWVYEDALGSYESGIHGNVTPYGILVKQQIWYCFVIPSDGIGSGAEIRSGGVEIHNSPPYVEEAQIDVVITDEDMRLELIYDSEDIDGDNLDTIEIRWYKNGNLQSQFDDNTTVSQNNLVKDDSWYARVRIYDGLNWSGWFQTQATIVPNTAPVISGTPTLSPSKANSSKDLVPAFSSLYQDPDGDPLSAWEIWWYRDNGHMEDYDDMQKIVSDLTTKGEIWYYKVRVSDGEDFSEWYSSTTSLIKNSAPSNVNLSHEEPIITLTETEIQEFQVSAEDNDADDTLSFRWTLDGRIVLFEEDVSNSIYLYKTDYDSEGEYILRLVISDGDDAYETTWNLNILKKNRLPVINVVEPEGTSASIKEKDTLNFAITKSDADGDSLDVKWYVDGVLVYEGADKYSFTPDYSSIRSRNVVAEVSETESGANSTFSWDIAVADVPEGRDREEFLDLSYDAWGLIMAIISGLAAILLFLFGFYRVRRKKGKLKEYMVEMDKVMEEDEDVEVVEEKLEGIENRIKDEFSQGKIEDLHFLMLQDIIDSKRGEIRKAEITQKFGGLPEGILTDLDEMLKDGKISRDEYEVFVSTISKTKSLSPYEKKELSRMIGEWEVEDKESPQERSSGEKVKPKKSKEDEELDHALDFLNELNHEGE